MTSSTNLVFILITHRPVSIAQTYILEPLALVASLFLTYLNHYRTRTSSSLLLLFWPLYAATLVIWARTLLGPGFMPLNVVFSLRVAAFGLGLVSYIIECFGPEFGETDSSENPLLTANLYSIWTFGWMDKLMQKGSKEYITEKDLPGLLPSDESARLGKNLQTSLQKQYASFSPKSLITTHSRLAVNLSGLPSSQRMADRMPLPPCSRSCKIVCLFSSLSFFAGSSSTSLRISLRVSATLPALLAL